MSKGIKSVVKAAVKFAGSKLADPLGLNKMIPGITSPIESALDGKQSPLSGMLGGNAAGMDELAQTQRDIASQQAAQATAEANEQARASAQAIQLANSRQAATAAAEANKPVDQSTVDVQLSQDTGSSSSRRKKFNSASVGAGDGGPAIRV